MLNKKNARWYFKTRNNRFRLYYEQDTLRNEYDLIVIVEFNNSDEKFIKVVTTYEQSKEGCVKLITDFKMVNEYDSISDTLYLRIINPYTYKESIELEDNIILDFDVNNVPVALEILDASKFFNVKPYSLRKFGLKMNIEIKEEKISLNASFMFLIHQKEEKHPVKVDTLNDIEIPALQTNYAVA